MCVFVVHACVRVRKFDTGCCFKDSMKAVTAKCCTQATAGEEPRPPGCPQPRTMEEPKAAHLRGISLVQCHEEWAPEAIEHTTDPSVCWVPTQACFILLFTSLFYSEVLIRWSAGKKILSNEKSIKTTAVVIIALLQQDQLDSKNNATIWVSKRRVHFWLPHCLSSSRHWASLLLESHSSMRSKEEPSWGLQTIRI